MYPFFESICLINGIPRNLEYHQKRLVATFNRFYPGTKCLNLYTIVQDIPVSNYNEVHKLKISYNYYSFEYNIQPYAQRKHKKFIINQIMDIQYSHKYSDRSFFKLAKAKALPDTEILFYSNNQFTDSTYSNLIFLKNNQWLTPKSYLLNGCMRQFLLDQKIISETTISFEDLPKCSGFKLINSMNSLEEAIEYPIDLIMK